MADKKSKRYLRIGLFGCRFEIKFFQIAPSLQNSRILELVEANLPISLTRMRKHI